MCSPSRVRAVVRSCVQIAAKYAGSNNSADNTAPARTATAGATRLDFDCVEQIVEVIDSDPRPVTVEQVRRLPGPPEDRFDIQPQIAQHHTPRLAHVHRFAVTSTHEHPRDSGCGWTFQGRQRRPRRSRPPTERRSAWLTERQIRTVGPPPSLISLTPFRSRSSAAQSQRGSVARSHIVPLPESTRHCPILRALRNVLEPARCSETTHAYRVRNLLAGLSKQRDSRPISSTA